MSEKRKIGRKIGFQCSDCILATIIKFGLNVQETTHISGEENWRCDTLSRLTQEDFTITEALERIGRRDTKVIDISDINSTTTLLRNCSPQVILNEEDDFLRFWTEVQSALNDIARDLALQHTLA